MGVSGKFLFQISPNIYMVRGNVSNNMRGFPGMSNEGEVDMSNDLMFMLIFSQCIVT